MTWLNGVVRVALIGVLAVCATSLRGQLDTGRARLQTERLRATGGERFVLTSTPGIDVTGRLVFDSMPAETKRVVVCGLRIRTLREDVDHWTAVADALPGSPRVEIIGYCDGPECRAALSRSPTKPPFTVIGYGEVVASQAVAGADKQGECLLLGENMRRLRRVQWRTPKQQPEDLVQEILR